MSFRRRLSCHFPISAEKRLRHIGAWRLDAALISACMATAAFADSSPDLPAIGSREPGEGVMRQLLNWQTCFKKDGTRDLAAILAACDRLADAPDLLPRQREYLARWRVRLTQGDQPQDGKSDPNDPKSGARLER